MPSSCSGTQVARPGFTAADRPRTETQAGLDGVVGARGEPDEDEVARLGVAEGRRQVAHVVDGVGRLRDVAWPTGSAVGFADAVEVHADRPDTGRGEAPREGDPEPPRPGVVERPGREEDHRRRRRSGVRRLGLRRLGVRRLGDHAEERVGPETDRAFADEAVARGGVGVVAGGVRVHHCRVGVGVAFDRPRRPREEREGPRHEAIDGVGRERGHVGRHVEQLGLPVDLLPVDLLRCEPVTSGGDQPVLGPREDEGRWRDGRAGGELERGQRRHQAGRVAEGRTGERSVDRLLGAVAGGEQGLLDAEEGATRHVGVPQDEPGDRRAAGDRCGGEERADAHPGEDHRPRSEPASEPDRVGHVGEPARDEVGVGERAGGVTGPRVVEPEGDDALGREEVAGRLQRPERVRGFVPERRAEHDGADRVAACGDVHPSRQRARAGPEPPMARRDRHAARVEVLRCPRREPPVGRAVYVL